MPYTVNEGAEIFWDSYGQGTPVLLIMGLSFTLEMWFRILPALTPGHRVILFDNRGVGRSSVPRGPYSIPKMARDAAAVLRAAEVPSAHVIGASMGGMIAQELALRHPELVRSMVLACTTHSGLFGRWPDFRYVPRRSSRDRGERERSVIKLLYADSTPLHLIEEDVRIRLDCQWSSSGFISQFAGILLWSSYGRLPRLRIPTLVVHGDQDRLIPPENGRAVARRIPGARFELIPNAGHVMTTDQPEMCRALMLLFLGEQTASEALAAQPQDSRVAESIGPGR